MNKIKFDREMIFHLVTSALFLIGAVFMLIYTFGEVEWCFWVGLSIAAAAVVVYVVMIIGQKKNPSYPQTADNKIDHGKENIEITEVQPEPTKPSDPKPGNGKPRSRK
jgi:Ca2+/Na+ antiporter